MPGNVKSQVLGNKLSEEYQANFEDWQVSLFDININVTCEHLPGYYMNSFGLLKGWAVREYYQAGKSYTTRSGSKAFTIYDKLKQMQHKGDSVPDGYANQNIMRLEMSVNKQPSRIKELQSMRILSQYCEVDNYRILPTLLLKSYNQIEKNENLEVIPGLSKNDLALLTAIKTYTVSGYKEKIRIEYPNNFRYHLRKVDELVDRVMDHRSRQGQISDLKKLNSQVHDAIETLIQSAA